MPNLKYAFLAILLSYLLVCRKDEKISKLTALDTLIIEGKYKGLPSAFGNLDLKDFQLTAPALAVLPSQKMVREAPGLGNLD